MSGPTILASARLTLARVRVSLEQDVHNRLFKMRNGIRTLRDWAPVVRHYDNLLGPGLSDQQVHDLVEYLKSL